MTMAGALQESMPVVAGPLLTRSRMRPTDSERGRGARVGAGAVA